MKKFDGIAFFAARTNMRLINGYFLLTISVIVAGCGSDSDKNAAEDGCNDLIDAFVESGGTCVEELGPDVEDLRDLIAAELGCSEVQDLRDENELYDECIPAVRELECADFLSLSLPAACEGQLLK